MSNTVQNKLANLEVAPPASAWTKIAEALEESHLSDKFPAILYAAEATAPAAVWEAIDNELTAAEAVYPSTLYNLQAAPPAGVWNKIESALDAEEREETVIPQRRRIAPFIRYAAAAVLVGCMAFGAYRLFDTPKPTATDNKLALEEILSPGKQDSESTGQNTSSANTLNEEVIITQEQQDAAALEQSKHTFASIDMGEKRKLALRINQELVGAPVSPISSANGITPENTYKDLECSEVQTPSFAAINPAFNMASRYTLLMSPDGHLIRVSRKLGDMVCCVSGEDQDEECKSQLDKWRKKIANSPVAPSPENFMDILDLLHALKDKSL
jgi:hypothetical protein